MNDPGVVSKADLILIIMSQIEAAGTHISIYLTIITAYLVTAFFVGRKLTSLQVSVATSIYVVAYLFEALILAGIFRASAVAAQSYRERFSVVSPWVVDSVPVFIYVGIIIVSAILLSSLWFMWSVRRPDG